MEYDHYRGLLNQPGCLVGHDDKNQLELLSDSKLFQFLLRPVSIIGCHVFNRLVDTLFVLWADMTPTYLSF